MKIMLSRLRISVRVSRTLDVSPALNVLIYPLVFFLVIEMKKYANITSLKKPAHETNWNADDYQHHYYSYREDPFHIFLAHFY